MGVLLPELIRGVAYSPVADCAYPRANPDDAERLPADIWRSALVPAGVRLELVGTASAVDVSYSCLTDDLGYRGPAAGTTFAVWNGEVQIDDQPAVVGNGRVRLRLGRRGPAQRLIVYLPEGMRPAIHAVDAVDGEIASAPKQARWIAYGDSITEGWSASAPAQSWTSRAARRHGFDVVNLGYAGAARAETVSAEGIAALTADVISIAVGTNCWNRIPHSVGMMRELLRGFLSLVRAGHPTTPIVVVSPVVRPDAEAAENLLKATLQDLRSAIEETVAYLMAAGDEQLTLVAGRDVLSSRDLVDGVHPGDEGHRLLAEAIGPVLPQLAKR